MQDVIEITKQDVLAKYQDEALGFVFKNASEFDAFLEK